MIWGLLWSFAELVNVASDLPAVPVHIIDQIMTAYLQYLLSKPIVRSTSLKFFLPSIPLDKGGDSYLPNLGRVLPHTWRDYAKKNIRAAKTMTLQ